MSHFVIVFFFLKKSSTRWLRLILLIKLGRSLEDWSGSIRETTLYSVPSKPLSPRGRCDFAARLVRLFMFAGKTARFGSILHSGFFCLFCFVLPLSCMAFATSSCFWGAGGVFGLTKALHYVYLYVHTSCNVTFFLFDY